MGRRIFEEGNFDLAGRVLPLESFRLFCDRSEGLVVLPEYREKLIDEAERLLDKTYPVLDLSKYLMFRRMGDRKVFETPYFERRRDMMVLALAEYLEGKGRFADKLCDLVWMILEETTWVLPAHSREKRQRMPLLMALCPPIILICFRRQRVRTLPWCTIFAETCLTARRWRWGRECFTS